MTELVFILDRSGSMSGLESDTIGGFNSMIARQKQAAGEALVSTVLFDNDSTVIHDRLPLGEVPPVLLSGHHREIAHWRRERSLELTARRRPDLIAAARAAGQLSARDERFLAGLGL